LLPAGTVLTCSLHLFCALAGAGVLALPNALAWLGWVAGPLLILLVYSITLLMMRLLASCYRVNDVEHDRYHHCVSHILGTRQAFLCSLFQITTLILADIALTITGATTAQDLALRAAGVDSGTAWYTKVWVMVLFFGAVELFLSQVRNLEEAWWVSAIGSMCTIICVVIVLIISGININGGAKGSVHGIQALPSTTDPGVDVPISTAKKAFGVLNALGMIAFGYSGSQVLLEIQHTLGQPPQPVASMKKVCNIAITMAVILYLAVGCLGYAAFGNSE